MILKDESMFMRKSGGGVVLDGLQLWIDGQDTVKQGTKKWGSFGSTFTDRVSGNEIEATTNWTKWHNNDDLTFGNDSGWDQFVKQTVYDNTKSIELSFRTTNSSSELSFFCNRPSMNERPHYFGVDYEVDSPYSGAPLWGGIWLYSKLADFRMPLRYNETPIYGTSHCVLSMRDDGFSDIYINGVLVSSLQGVEFPTDYQYMLYTVSPISFGAIRFYDRPLTESEVLQNYNYEKSLGRVD